MPKYCIISALTLILFFVSISDAGVWSISHADVDGDGIEEGIDYVIGENGEHNIPYQYYPPAHLIAWNTARTCMSIHKLRQVLMEGNNLLLDTGEPTLYNWDVFNYADAFYDTMFSYYEGSNVITRWESQYAILERINNLNDVRGINRYKLWLKTAGGTSFLGETALLAIWNDGMQTIEQAKTYVLNHIQQFKGIYLDSFPGLVSNKDLTFKISYIFDDFVSRLDSYSVLCWDGYNYNAPDTRAIWGTLHLPEPCSLFCETRQSGCTEYTYVFWKSRQAWIQASINIEPRVINLRSHGKFTAFITLPTGYDPGDINLSTVRCEGAMAVEGYVSATTFIAKFNVQDLMGVAPGPAVEFLLTGQLNDGSLFSGVDTVRVILPGTTLLAVKPNPCHKYSTVMLQTENQDLIEVQNVKIYDEMGRLVRRFSITPGMTTKIVWDIKNDAGCRVPPGIYFCKLESAVTQTIEKLIVLP